MELNLIYDKIYRYVFFKVRDTELAEDITQETFLRHIEKKGTMANYDMRYLYAIAKNLCIDEFRRIKEYTIPEVYEEMSEFPENEIIINIELRRALLKMDKENQELLLLRYVNEEPIATLCKLYGYSRFAIYRKLKKAEKELREILEVSGNE